MSVVKLARPTAPLADFLTAASIEVMPRTAAKIPDFKSLLEPGRRIYIADIEGTPFDDMLATAKRLRRDGFRVMPHIPARLVKSATQLEDWLTRYAQEADLREALVLAGGIANPHGPFDSTLQLLETGLFEKYGFTRLHVAGHPEGNRDIDPDGGQKNTDAAISKKQHYATATGTDMALVTQFVFDTAPLIHWADGLRSQGVTLPIHAGVAGPAKLQTLIRYAIACGVGPSLGVLQNRARDLTKLLRPFEPTQVLTALAEHKSTHPDSLIQQAHIFPLGGIKTSAAWLNAHRG